jgi:hypothetical protein
MTSVSKQLELWLAFLFLVITLLPIQPTIAADSAQKAWQSKQMVWWNEAQLVKTAVVSVLALQAANPTLQSAPTFTEHRTSVTDLLLLFDSMRSKGSVETLAELTPYYFGEAPGEMYSCLLLRKGKALVPLISKLLASKRNECIEKFGPPKDRLEGLEVPVCLADETYRSRLRSTLEGIRSGATCTIEQ